MDVETNNSVKFLVNQLTKISIASICLSKLVNNPTDPAFNNVKILFYELHN